MPRAHSKDPRAANDTESGMQDHDHRVALSPTMKQDVRIVSPEKIKKHPKIPLGGGSRAMGARVLGKEAQGFSKNVRQLSWTFVF